MSKFTFMVTVSGSNEEKQQEAMILFGILRKIDQFSAIARRDAEYIDLHARLTTKGALPMTIDEQNHPHFSAETDPEGVIKIFYNLDADKWQIAEISPEGKTRPIYNNINMLHDKWRNKSPVSVTDSPNNSASSWKKPSENASITLSRSSCSFHAGLNRLGTITEKATGKATGKAKRKNAENISAPINVYAQP